MDQALLERYAPASALIDVHHRVLYLRGPTEDYLRPPSGEPSYDLLAMAFRWWAFRRYVFPDANARPRFPAMTVTAPAVERIDD